MKCAPKYARIGNPTCHPAVTDLHADLSSAAAEIYAASTMPSCMLYLSYISDELGILFKTPIKIHVDNHWQTALSFAIGTVKKGKLRHIDTQCLWIQRRVRDGSFELRKVLVTGNPADIFTKHTTCEEGLGTGNRCP